MVDAPCSPMPNGGRGRPLNSKVNATGLRTALWRCDLGAELPLVADLRHSICGTFAANDRLQAFKNSASFNDPFSHLQ